jgi:ankyrin repeat protein
MENGADPNASNEGGRTPLHVCSERNTSTSVIKLLIAAGSELNARDSSGGTPLAYPRDNKCDKIVEYLTSIGGR